ncbi:MAG: glutaredoxin 3 [Rickettsiales bacterium]|nr:MAG: glutaredoxin 3 [Rickettsiales bacterium]
MKKIIIYTTTICPYCDRAKALLKRKNLSFEEINVEDENTRNLMVQKANGRKTVPQIFIGDYHVGGCDDLYSLEQNNKLDELII